MAEVVDSIVAQLEVRLGNYVTNFETATKAANGHTDALKRLAEASRLADRMMTDRAHGARRAPMPRRKRTPPSPP